MKPRDIPIQDQLSQALARFEQIEGALPGIADPASRETLLRQMIDSLHRVRYPRVIRERELSREVTDPDSIAFDPVKAAAFHHLRGDTDEACWLTFFFVHFGKHGRGGWRYLREVYAGNGSSARWTWVRTSANPEEFRTWLRHNSARITRKSEPGGFGNHRKYESLDADKPNGTAEVVASYIRWVSPPRSHTELIAQVTASAEDPRRAFAALYDSMQVVHRFGRTARFDYLAMLGKLEIANIVPDKAYLREATGPRAGAQLLFAGESGPRLGAAQLEDLLQRLDEDLKVGMQVLEDSLCNWQKRPKHYVAFRG